ncbi:hypothetical protein [Bacillus sp. AFS017336]|uniref:hypothetical protein n=1 Tax=Bacillus sp. AFS017336 TaxID=2033489 RepID=UPI000BF074B0|nr:hypothetical protein [Bacillus sp. AFS017336]PEL06735.1 hypothetical protein CN601_20630 [Bacillus sp. AFS017336]
MERRSVVVEYRYEDHFREEENEIGVYCVEAGVVIVADAIGGVAIYHAHPSPTEGAVVVDLDNDGEDHLSDNPELLINLILE